MRTLKISSFHIIIAIFIMAMISSVGTPVLAVEDPNASPEEVKSTGWKVQKTPARDAEVTIQSVVTLDPKYYLGTYYFVFSDYSTAHEGCDRISLEMTIPGTTLQAKPVKAASGRVYWVIPFKPTDYPVSLQQPFTVQVKYRVRLYRLKLVPGTDAFAKITPDERKRFTSTDSRFNFNEPAFQHYIDYCGLRRWSGESDLDFAYRVYKTMTSKLKFASANQYFKSTSTINLAAMNCESASVFFTSVLRSANIPARSMVGYSAGTDKPFSSNAAHIFSDFYIENIGWLSTDISQDMRYPPKNRVEETFGLCRGATIPWFLVEGDNPDIIDLGNGVSKQVYQRNTVSIAPEITDQYGNTPKGDSYSAQDLWGVKQKTL